MGKHEFDRKVRNITGGIVFFVIAILGLLALTSCSSGSPIPWDRVEVYEVDSDLAGGYSIERINLGERWPESKSWIPLQTRLSQQIVCFGFFDDPRLSASFFANPDFQWVEVQYQGRNCLELKRK